MFWVAHLASVLAYGNFESSIEVVPLFPVAAWFVLCFVYLQPAGDKIHVDVAQEENVEYEFQEPWNSWEEYPEDLDTSFAWDDANLENHSACLMAKYFPHDQSASFVVESQTSSKVGHPIRWVLFQIHWTGAR